MGGAEDEVSSESDRDSVGSRAASVDGCGSNVEDEAETAAPATTSSAPNSTATTRRRKSLVASHDYWSTLDYSQNPVATIAESEEMTASSDEANTPTKVMAAVMDGTLTRPPPTVTLPSSEPLPRRRMSAMAIMG